ncbi:MAG TPA: hypothetical protein VG844_10110 [Terracidiphilus sp.]|jgi:hypothetical protein|nr:hypothetical protein [Terracidiphilus sp.]
MREKPTAEAQESPELRSLRSGPDLERRYPIALAAFVVLAALVWFTMDPSKVLVWGKPVDLRLVPMIVIGGLALRTMLAVQADRIRRRSEEEQKGRS